MSLIDLFNRQQPADRQYPGGSATFDESAAGRGAEIPISGGGDWFDSNSTTAGINTSQQAADYTRNYAANPPSLPGGSQTSAQGGDPGQAWTSSGGRTVQDWQNFVRTWNGSHGPNDQITIIGSAQGGGTYHGVNYDAVLASHEGGRGAQWLGPGSAGGGGGGFGSLSGAPTHFSTPYQNFTPPSLEDARNSPGYQFALQQGLQGIERSAASKGTLLTGGTLKAMAGYGTGLADQTYQNVFNRALTTNQTNYGNDFNTNQGNFGNLSSLLNVGQRSAAA